MQGPFVVDASHPITAALSCFAPPETLYAPEAAQSHISWLHDGHPPNSNGSEYLILFITLWHACRRADLANSLFKLQPDLSLDFFFDSELRAPGFSIATATPTTLLEHLAAGARLSPHPKHVPVLTSPGGDRLLEVWLCDSVLFLSDAAQCLTSRLTVARSCQYVGYGVQNTGGGGGGDSSERIFACRLLDTCYCGPPSDVGLPLARGCWRVGYDIDDGSTIVVVRMPPAGDCAPTTVQDSALLEGSWQGHCALGPGMASPDLDDPDSPSSSSESQGQARARDGRPSTSAVFREESHEARGIGLIVKALVQQNAGASLFLRTMVCVAALLCFTHAIFVLGERPSLFVGCRTS